MNVLYVLNPPHYIICGVMLNVCGVDMIFNIKDMSLKGLISKDMFYSMGFMLYTPSDFKTMEDTIKNPPYKIDTNKDNITNIVLNYKGVYDFKFIKQFSKIAHSIGFIKNSKADTFLKSSDLFYFNSYEYPLLIILKDDAFKNGSEGLNAIWFIIAPKIEE